MVQPFLRGKRAVGPTHPVKHAEGEAHEDLESFRLLSPRLSMLAAWHLLRRPRAPAQPAAPIPNQEVPKDLVLCYPQLGAESDWRTANSASFKETAAQLGIKQLIFSDAQQKQENQISAIRSCIQQGVNVIALPPVVETGWDAVLTEAKNAGIPVIVVDRSVTADPSLYRGAHWLGYGD
jgi:ABC-type sugar transport system substrate-binding protein